MANDFQSKLEHLKQLRAQALLGGGEEKIAKIHAKVLTAAPLDD